MFSWAVCQCEVQDGAVTGCESKSKSNSALAERGMNLKVQEITPNVGCVYSGLGTDYQVLLKSLRKKAINYSLRFGVEMPKREVVKSAVSTMQEFEQRGFVYDGKFDWMRPVRNQLSLEFDGDMIHQPPTTIKKITSLIHIAPPGDHWPRSPRNPDRRDRLTGWRDNRKDVTVSLNM
jgi:hypothetical protein